MRVLMLASLAAAAVATAPPNKIMLFKSFVEKYDRHYATKHEESSRFKIFSANVDFIYASNAKNRTFTLGITDNADKTFEEFRALYLGGLKPKLTASKDRSLFTKPESFDEPDEVDWVAKGGVTEVKYQGTCGACWTFSTAGALEGAMFVAGRSMVDLSMQSILACDQGGNGCNGGPLDQAFDWVQQNGLPALSDEPYLCADVTSEQCTSMTCPNPAPPLTLAVGDVTQHTDVDQSEGALEAAVAQQPVSVAIEADQPVFQHYTGGILTDDACGSQLDHGVLAVGYGVDNGQKYWKVKNSWGTQFGEDGYIRIEKGSSSEGGECGIRKAAVFPTVQGASKAAIVV